MKNISATKFKDARLTAYPASAQVPQRRGAAVSAVTLVLDFYHALLGPFLAAHSGSSCRFEPSCSCYAKTALARHGLRRGGYMAMRRLARCHPCGGYGYDPVPQAPSLKSGSQ
jgi:uncharacterized protein